MSAKADGTIIIDTKIDTDGIPEGMESMMKDIKSGTSDVGNLGKETGEKFTDGFEKGIGDMPDIPIEEKTIGVQEKLDALSGSMTSFGNKMSLAVTAPLVALGGKMVSSASDMEENLNKVDVAFGKSADGVKAWADTATESFGLSKNQALEATSLFGDMATSMGLPQDAAANMSTSLAGLAGDLASFKNIDIEQAMTALNGVFTGETESLKTLGIVMTETNLKQFAEDAGLVYDEMSQAEKVQLRYAYVMETTKNAQGDYARTADGTANSMRTLQASFDNLIAILGESLLPAITPIIQFITDLLQKFSELDPKTQKVIVIIGAVLAAIGPVVSVIGGIISVVSTLIPIITAVVSALNPVTLAIGAVIAAIVLLIKNWDAVKETMQKFDDFLQEIFAKDFTEVFGPVLGEALNAFFQNVENIWNSIKQIFNGIVTFISGVFAGDWEKAWEGIKDIFEGVFKAFEALAKAPLNAVIGAINGLIGGVEKGLNKIIEMINDIDFDIPDWVPVFGGKSFDINIPKVKSVKIPYLAQGAVIPPNAPFMAVLGDQRHGNNIETPEDLLRKVVREESGRNSGNGATYHFVAQLNGQTLFEQFIDQARLNQVSTGQNILQTL